MTFAQAEPSQPENLDDLPNKQPSSSDSNTLNKGEDQKTSIGVIEIHPDSLEQRKNLNQSSFVSYIPITNDQETVADILQKAPGIQINRWGTGNALATASIRGSESNQVLIYIDGMPLYNEHAGITDLSDIQIQGIKRIEVYQDSAPADFAHDSVGGIINIVTEEGSQRNLVDISLGAGSFGSYNSQIFIIHPLKKWQSMAWLSGQVSQGDFPFHNNNQTPIYNHADDFRDRRTNNAHGEINQKTIFRYQDARIPWRWQIGQDYQHRRQEIPGSESAIIQKANQQKDIAKFHVHGERYRFQSDNMKLTTKLYGDLRFHSLYDPDQELLLGSSQIDRQFYNTGVGLGLTRISQSHLMAIFQNFSLHRYMESMDTDNNENFSTQDELTDRNYKRNTQARTRLRSNSNISDKIQILKLKNQRSYLIPALRLELSQDKAEINNRQAIINPALGILHNYQNFLSFKANIKIQSRQPTFLELYGDSGQIIGNENLVNENSKQWDVGFALFKSYSQHTLTASSNYFYRETDDLITIFQNSQNTARFENLHRSQSQGIEFSGQWFGWRKLTSQISYTLLNSLDKSSISAYHNKQLPFRPKHSVSARLEYKAKIWRFKPKLGMQTHYKGINYLDRSNSRENFVPARLQIDADLKIEHTDLPQFWLEFSAKNLTNSQNEDVIGYPLPGIHIYLTLGYHLYEAK